MRLRSVAGHRLLVTAATATGIYGFGFQHNAKKHASASSSRATREFLSPTFIADAVDVASPSVVNVLGQSSVKGIMGRQYGASSGSGFIISSDGFVATNAHVIANSADGRVLITMWDGRKRTGVVHSADAATDIALVQITDLKDGEELPVATFGSSSKLRPGEFVVALGSPLLLQNSVTFGIVSSTARPGTELGMRQSRLEYIQTDASINRGNSGGPLCDLDGKVIGINTMKAQATEGISFAIPVDTAKQVIEQLRRSKRVVRPFIGINMVNYNPNTSARKRHGDTNLGSDEVQVLVVAVEKNSPAALAGLKDGDVILAVDGKPLRGVQSLLRAIGVEIGKTLELKVQRRGDVFNASVTTSLRQEVSSG